MKLEIQDLRPEPIPEASVRDSSVWGANLTLGKGQRCLVAAESGRGKSTLLHVLCGIRRDYSGVILLDGKEVAMLLDSDWTDLRAKRISLLFQDLRLFPNLTGRENLALLPQSGETAHPLDFMASRLGLEEHLDKPCSLLSHGQRQRVALIRALARPFELLLLDEPFSHLDEENAQRACELIEEELDYRGASLLLTSLGDKPDLAFSQEWKL